MVNAAGAAAGVMSEGVFGPAGEGGAQGFFGRTATAAIAGGTASVLTGGKFANAAITAAFAQMWNGESQNWEGVQAVQRKIVQTALGYEGSIAWNSYGYKDDFRVGTNKCNLFVYDVLTESGAWIQRTTVTSLFGWVEKQYPPVAADWANPKVRIPGWFVVNRPQPGDIAAVAKASFNATGHVSIVTGIGSTTGTAGNWSIKTTDWGFRAGQSPTFRRYVGQ